LQGWAINLAQDR